MVTIESIDMRALGERVLLLRRRAGWSQNELARLAGVDVMTISRLERGDKKRLEIEPLARLATALHVTTDFLLGLSEHPEGSQMSGTSADTTPPAPPQRQRTRKAAPVG
jgi:transcriptional regulator with XRE-family HTH domain